MKILKAGGYVWADRGKIHKQGKVVADYAIYPLKSNYLPMAPIQAVPQAALDRPLDLKLYPDFWVDLDDCVGTEIIPSPSPAASDKAAGEAFVLLVKWIASLF